MIIIYHRRPLPSILILTSFESYKQPTVSVGSEICWHLLYVIEIPRVFTKIVLDENDNLYGLLLMYIFSKPEMGKDSKKNGKNFGKVLWI
jgi:hypothetical protein